ncbi:ACLY-like protein [Mya arenaria]|uniref:ATP citrate synthase n=1 Tax=Mya arenaria TaxID=6604 RepID=A0ABY7ERN2_MYAAR|nr:ACLY-like protein [Mya arenaria]
MSAKAIYEAKGKELLNKYLESGSGVKNRYAVVTEDVNWDQLVQDNPWLQTQKLVVKPDQLIKRRGKLGLIKAGVDLAGVRDWLKEKLGKNFTIGKALGRLRRFIIEPFVAHEQSEEYYVCIYSHRSGDTILFHHEGGVDIGDVDAKAVKMEVPIGEDLSPTDVEGKLLLTKFITSLYKVYTDLYFTYLEINPLVVTSGGIYVLDLAAKIDQCAEYLCKGQWGELEFPPPFGRDALPEEAYIAELDSKSGASLKLTVLNKTGRIWTMVAGGGASVIYAEQQTYEYAKTVLSLMTEEKHPDGKILIIGGGIANFTNGIVRALREYQQLLIEGNVNIYVRRAGPNFQEGLRIMRELGNTLGVPIHVFGPETHMTAIASPSPSRKSSSADLTKIPDVAQIPQFLSTPDSPATKPLFTKGTKAIIWGMQARAVQGMMDFDYKFYWGHKEVLVPVYKNMDDCMKKHPSADVLVSFASLRSAYDSTVETMKYQQIRTIAIIAEGIPENLTRKLVKMAHEKGVNIIGPATVGGVKPGCFKIGNTGGMLDNILSSKLYRPGSVAYVSRSGGMSNELNNIIALNTDGVYEGVAIGGDRYPGTTFMDHIYRYQADPDVKMIVLLGEVGGVEEYELTKALTDGRVNKPVVAWCIGTCAKMFTSEVQFGHAGSCANADAETADAKNRALQEAGARVPKSFDELGHLIKEVYDQLVADGTIQPRPEEAPPTVPMDYAWATELGLIRKPASFMTSICDERGQELLYAGIPITDIFKEDMGIGGVLSLLWFQRRLPRYATKFIEMCLMVTADHGPAVSGAHNTIVCARAGKDLVSCLTSGLLTIGDRFGGALDAAAKQFSDAVDSGLIPMEFVNGMRKKGKLIMGIGHRVKSINNPDMRVVILKEYAQKSFPATPMLDYAIEVERITTSKKPNLILNVDGFIGVAFVDLLRNCGCFTRSMGFIGHFLDQKRLKQGLYRHPWDDISYVMPEQFGEEQQEEYDQLVADGTIQPCPEEAPPTVPMDYAWATELELIRKPASLMTSICDERGQVLLYAGIPITDIFKEDMGIGGVLSLLWFQRSFPCYTTKFIKFILLFDMYFSGYLAKPPSDRFGGALGAAAKQFSGAVDSGLIPMEFVNGMRKKGKLIMGIGHRVKSINNPDMRLVILKEYAQKSFPVTPMLDYVIEVERITTSRNIYAICSFLFFIFNCLRKKLIKN